MCSHMHTHARKLQNERLKTNVLIKEDSSTEEVKWDVGDVDIDVTNTVKGSRQIKDYNDIGRTVYRKLNTTSHKCATAYNNWTNKMSYCTKKKYFNP